MVSYAAFKFAIERGFFPVVVKYMEQNTMEVHELGRTFDAAFKHGHIRIMSHAVRYRALNPGHVSVNQPLSPKTSHRVEDVKRHQVLDSFLERFQKNCCNKEIVGDMELSNIRFMRAEVFIEQGRFMSYDECEKGGLLVSGEDLTPQTNVLMIIHPWTSKGDIMEHKIPFQQAVKFIQDFPNRTDIEGQGPIDLVWFEGSCLCPPPSKRKKSYTGSRIVPPSKDAPVAPCLADGFEGELHQRHMRMLPVAALSAAYCLCLPRMMVFEGYEQKAKEQYNRFTGLLYSDIDDLLSDNLCNTQILMCVISGCKVFCEYFVHKPHEFCLCNIKRWDVTYLNGEALLIQDKPYADSDVEKPDPAMNVWFRSASIGAINKIEDIAEKRQLWYGILRDFWFLEIVDPTVTLAKCVLSVLDISDNDPGLLKRIWAFGLREKDMAQNRLTVMDEEGKDWDLSFNVIAQMMGHLSKGQDPALALNTLLLTIAFCMGKEPTQEEGERIQSVKLEHLQENSPSHSTPVTPTHFVQNVFESVFANEDTESEGGGTSQKFAPGGATLRTKQDVKNRKEKAF
mmetsp:Transcript_31581/g.41731  ORF Transcript_31581/g.41731 Transcript_31581/m.41731 type:complete len:567 (-) Transcript_31581:199-1899(-)